MKLVQDLNQDHHLPLMPPGSPFVELIPPPELFGGATGPSVGKDLRGLYLRETLAESPSLKSTYHKPSDVLRVRNALKFATKLLRDDAHTSIHDLSISTHANEASLLLTLAGSNLTEVVASLLYHGFRIKDPSDRDGLTQTVTRKFGSKVMDLISLTLDFAEGRKTLRTAEGRGQFRSIAPLLCAITTAEISTGFSKLNADELTTLERRFRRAGVPEILLNQLKIEAPIISNPIISNVVQYKDPGVSPTENIDVDFGDIVRGVRFASRLFQGIERAWGPNETLPLTSHVVEVGMLLALAGERPQLVIAGLLHDAYERYVPTPVDEIRQKILVEYGPEVVRLVDSVTEPPKSSLEGNWLTRKEAVLRKLEEGGRDAATLSCAAKISTFAAGNKMLYMGEDISTWSSGGLVENIEMGIRYLKLFVEKRVPSQLCNQFLIELHRMNTWAGKAA